LAVMGRVNARAEAVVRLPILGADEHREEVELVLDTGFTGQLLLPSAIVARLGLTWQGVREAVLGDGRRTAMRIYRAKTIWDGRERDAQVLESEGGPLLGMSFLWDHAVRLDVIDGGTVVIEPLR
jgi:clan AA aspartic protease